MKQHILFVDDEMQILEGLRRSLRNQRHEWEMAFATSAAEALKMAAQRRFDAVVSDMRMPGMDGAQFLEEIAKLYPETVRIILSGYSDQEMAMRTTGFAHQYLNKPCHPETIKSVLSNAFSLRDMLRSEKLKTMISSLKSIPSVPATYCKLLEAIESGEANFSKVGEIISHDPPMAAKLLQLVNSAFFGQRQQISNPGDAAIWLGFDTIRGLILFEGVFSQLDTPQLQADIFSPHQLWQHSMSVSALARAIAKSENAGKSVVDGSQSAGLLHDVGKLVLAYNLPHEWRRITELVQGGMSAVDAEESILGVQQGLIGAYLLGLWGLPDHIVEAVAFQRNPAAVPHTEFTPLTAVHVANAIVLGNDTLLDMEYLSGLGLEDRLDGWRTLFTGSPTELKHEQ